MKLGASFTDKALLFLAVLLIGSPGAHAQMRTDTFTFSFEGRRYSGLMDLPEQQPVTALIMIVPGSGKTDIVAGDWYHDLRSHFTGIGLACLIWDKAGCGKSEGAYHGDPPVRQSAGEVVAAITEARSRNVPGSGTIGLWGISRAGWICPLVMERTPIAFWISVSGVDDKETYGYLLERNFRIEGRSRRKARELALEWHRGNAIVRTGGTLEAYTKATAELRADPFFVSLNGADPPTPEGYAEWQASYRTGEIVVDEKTGLRIYIPDFDKLLSKIDVPVLALFGEKDSQVDWRRTRALYKRTIGKNPHADLETHVLPDCNHGMLQCRTGGYREKLEDERSCKGYYGTMLAWLKEKGFAH